MDTIKIVNQLLLTAHFVGLIGLLVCLPLICWHFPRIFLPALGGWSSFRLTRLLGMLTRAGWLAWLSGLALLMVRSGSLSQSTLLPVYRDKLILVFLLALSATGLEMIVRRGYMAREGGVGFVRGIADGLWMRFAIALFLATLSALIYLLTAFIVGSYSGSVMLFTGTVIGTLCLASLLMVDDRWLNGYTQLTSSRSGG